MRFLVIAVFIVFALPAFAQDTPVATPLVEGLNKAIGATPDDRAAAQDTNSSGWNGSTAGALFNESEVPYWGVVVEDASGAILDVFGQVPYETTATGSVLIPGYERPPGTVLRVVPSSEWKHVMAVALSTGATNEIDPSMAPITTIPSVVFDATDYLANNLCGIRGRPSALTLVMMVNAGGTIFFAEAGGEAGSEVYWDFANDVCPSYGLEGEGIALREAN